MIDIQTFRQAALAYPGAAEEPHFEKTSFRIGKKIFATYDAKNNRACLKLTESDQDLFSLYDKTIIYPIPNKWGKMGWTFIELGRVNPATCLDALKHAYELVSSPKKTTKSVNRKK
jgi:predicted DNA-binding protein (MmcQ/YjbR family)